MRGASQSGGICGEGSRHRIGSLLLGYYTPQGRLTYAGRVGTGMPVAELAVAAP